MSNVSSPSPHLESDLWRWLLFESGLKRGRARELILQGAQSNALSLFWQAGPDILVQQLALSPDEAAHFQDVHKNWAAHVARFEAEREQGVQTLRLNQPGYPDSLLRFTSLERRPLLLFLRGERALLEMPLLLPVAGTPPAEKAVAWALEAFAELIAEGALPLLIARAGFEAQLARAFLDAEMPFVLVIPQGLAAYTPPVGLAQALREERVLLISPFRPDFAPPPVSENPLLAPAVDFARALAHAHLTLALPAPAAAAGQPCFRWPELTAGEGCPEAYEDAETLFLRLAESVAPHPPGVMVTASQPPIPTAPVDPAEILEILARGGDIPPALAQRLHKGNA